MSGALVAVVGPSGAGKDTLLAALCAQDDRFVLARRCITRPAEAGGEDHDAVSPAEFADLAAKGAFVMHWQAHGLHYGIPRGVLDRVAAGRMVLFNGSRAALPACRAACPALRVVMITAPQAVLAHRLAARGRESPAQIAARLDRAALRPPPGAAVVVNDGPVAQGVARLAAALGVAPRFHSSGQAT
jgi:ribose 1,5-bisphosphokinase